MANKMLNEHYLMVYINLDICYMTRMHFLLNKNNL